jgi:hypothetical protein
MAMFATTKSMGRRMVRCSCPRSELSERSNAPRGALHAAKKERTWASHRAPEEHPSRGSTHNGGPAELNLMHTKMHHRVVTSARKHNIT